MNRIVKVLLVIILASTLVPGLLTVGCSSGSTSTPTTSPTQGVEVGKRAPDFTLPNLEGQSVSLSDFRGMPVFINFWASWCGPCRAEMPFIQEVFEDKEWLDKGLVILGVDIGESPVTVERFMGSLGLSFPVLLDASQDVALKYNVRAIPTSFFIDKNGIIQALRIGAFSNKASIENHLGKIIP